MKHYLPAIALAFLAHVATAETVFLEAESFASATDGWQVAQNPQTRAASRLRTLHGSGGDKRGVARKEITVRESASYRVWVRYLHHETWRGAFRLAVLHDGTEIAAKDFDTQGVPEAKSWDYLWGYFDAELPEATLALELSKFEHKNCSGYVRNVDCVLVTTDKTLAPSHVPYGPQTFLRVTLAEIYEEPVHIHIFADHYRGPWYQHFHLSRAGANPGLRPAKSELMLGGEQTPWCNITPMLYQDSGAILNVTIRHTYHRRASRLKAKLEFATAANDESIVRTMDVDSEPNGLVVVMPPDLTTAENLGRLKRDKEFAEETGRIADAFEWPGIGKKPERFPFFVSATVGGYGTPVDRAVAEREWKTLDYFGFCNRTKEYIGGGVWYAKEGSYCRPDVERMKKQAAALAREFSDNDRSAEQIVFCMLMDEPAGQSSALAARDNAYHEAFRGWLKRLGKVPADLLLPNWDAVKPVPESARDDHPTLHYFTQRFRTRALGDFMAVQRGVLEEAYGRSLPTLVNFSDGATYFANFYGQGVDYFELLDSDDQNAIWSEDWANGSSSDQCGAYNVDLMRAASRDRGQMMGHYLIAHAGRKPWDVKLKAAGETARGVRIWKNFSYGVSWGSHEGGPAWRSHTWYSKPETWRANAEVVREIGGAEDLLLSAAARPAEVAILYSSSSDAWTSKRNHAYGFNRMHTWMALAHAQVPVDFVAERQVERGGLAGYKVCYLSGPNLTRDAAENLSAWVRSGGVLFLSAGAATRDEFNRPLGTFDSLLPASRKATEELQPFLNSGAYAHILQAKDTVSAEKCELEVLSVRQRQTPRDGAEVLAGFADGSPAIVRTEVGAGMIYSAGFLPGLDYIKQAVVSRRVLSAERDDAKEAAAGQGSNPTPTPDLPGKEASENSVADARLERSRNPWDFSAEVRGLILQPVRAAKVTPPLTCSVALVDAVVLHAKNGLVVPLANYTLTPLERVDFSLRVERPIGRIETVHRGPIDFKTGTGGKVEFSVPLDATDYVKLYYR